MEEKRNYEICLWWDEEARIWIAEGPELCMVLEGEDLFELIARSYIVAEEMLELNNLPPIAQLSILNKGIVKF